MPLSRSEFTSFATVSAPGGRMATWFETTSPTATDFAIDSACALSLSLATWPPKVTTPLSRSWLTETSLRLDWSRELRMLSATSGDLDTVLEHPLKVLTAASTKHIRPALYDFIYFLWS